MSVIRNLPFIAWTIRTMSVMRRYGIRIDACRRDDKDPVKERCLISEAVDLWTPQLFRRFKVSLEVEGRELVPEGAALFVSNHQGYGDIFAFMLAMSGKQVGFVARENLARIPVFGKWILRVRSLLLQRGDARSTLEVFKIGADWLKDGFSLVIFPEGTRSRSSQMGHFKKGSLKLATDAGVPVVPVTLDGTWHLYEEKGYVRPGAIRFHIHPPIATEGLTRAEIKQLPERVEQIIRSKLIEWNSTDAAGQGESTQGDNGLNRNPV
jgi:1-acyl-sn-glycerol-3-phosphate acyltransferase